MASAQTCSYSSLYKSNNQIYPYTLPPYACRTMATGGIQYASCRTLASVSANLLRRYTFLLKLPRNSGIFFLKEEKEEVWEDNPAGSLITQILDLLGLEFRKSSSLIFLFPTDFTDTHRLLTYSVLRLKHNSGIKILPVRRSGNLKARETPDG